MERQCTVEEKVREWDSVLCARFAIFSIHDRAHSPPASISPVIYSGSCSQWKIYPGHLHQVNGAWSPLPKVTSAFTIPAKINMTNEVFFHAITEALRRQRHSQLTLPSCTMCEGILLSIGLSGNFQIEFCILLTFFTHHFVRVRASFRFPCFRFIRSTSCQLHVDDYFWGQSNEYSPFYSI